MDILKTKYPAKTIGYYICDMLGDAEYSVMKKVLDSRNNGYMLNILSDAMFIMETSFFRNCSRRNFSDMLYDIETTTPTIYYLLYIRLSEWEIENNFKEQRRLVTEKSLSLADEQKLMSITNKQEFIYFAQKLIEEGKYQYVRASREEREKISADIKNQDFEIFQQQLYCQI